MSGSRCQFPRRGGRPCRVPANYVWSGLDVCHLHHPDLPHAVAQGERYRAWLARKLTRAAQR